MARKNKFELPDYTEIEVVSVKGKQAIKKIIKLNERHAIKRKKGWKYYFFQKDYSQFKTT